jgi:hypothetical protein
MEQESLYQQCVDTVSKAVSYLRTKQKKEDAELLVAYYMLLSRVNTYSISTFAHELQRIKETYHLELSCRHYCDEFAENFLQPIEQVRITLTKARHAYASSFHNTRHKICSTDTSFQI